MPAICEAAHDNDGRNETDPPVQEDRRGATVEIAVGRATNRTQFSIGTFSARSTISISIGAVRLSRRRPMYSWMANGSVGNAGVSASCFDPSLVNRSSKV